MAKREYLTLQRLLIMFIVKEEDRYEIEKKSCQVFLKEEAQPL